jgi:cytochrome c oxidase subunit IV
METQDAAAVKRQLQSHLKVFWVLLLVMGANVAVAFLPLDRPVRVGLHVGLSMVCGALVLTFYMHLVSETLSTHLVLGVTGFFFVALLALTLVARWSHPDLTELNTGTTSPPATAGGHHVP